jgi:probable F420-dependent oxidoreductase
MRFSLQLPTDRVDAIDEFVSAEAVAEMASAAERAGFDAAFVTDHPIPDDRWLASGGHHTLDPFVALSFAAMATESLRLHTHVVVLAYRNPFLTAKAAASLDVLSGGRLILGVATGYLAPEFAALGVDVDERNALSDEAIDTLLAVWGGESVDIEGRHFRASGHTALPRPAQRPHPPIWVGGNSRRAIRRAVEKADGWSPFPAPARLAARVRTAALASREDLARRIDYARSHAEAIGRTRPLDICFAPIGLPLDAASGPRHGAGAGAGPDELLDGIAGLERLGVSWLCVTLPARTRVEYLEQVGGFGEAVLSKRG